MKIKVSNATERQLDWLVAKCEGHDLLNIYGYERMEFCPKYSTDRNVGGLIIEREKLTTTYVDDPGFCTGWVGATQLPSAKFDVESGTYYPDGSIGPTPLIAGLRCYVGLRLGDVVEIPEELCK